MSVLVIANQFTNKLFAGGDRVFVEICKRWAGNGIRLDIIAPDSGVNLCKEYGLKGNYHILSDSVLEKTSSLMALPMVFLIRAWKTARLWHQHRQQSIVYTPGDFISNTLPAAWFKLFFKCPWIIHIYIVIPTPGRRKLSLIKDIVSWTLQRFSFLLVKRFANLVVVLDQMTANQLVQAGIPKSKIFVSSGGIPLNEIDETSKDKSVSFDGCFVGRIHPSKGALDLVEIWSKVTKKMKNATLAMIGGGSEQYLSLLRTTIKDANMGDNILLLGPQKNPFNFVKSSKVFLYPDHEIIYGWALAVAEAMACNLPAVVYDQPGHKMAYGDGIVLITRWDTEEYANAVIRLLQDEKLRQSIGAKGRQRIEQYDWVVVADHLWGKILEATNLQNKTFRIVPSVSEKVNNAIQLSM